MVKAINAGIEKVKPFIKKTAMATMFATSVIACDANTKKAQSNEPAINQTEVVSKSGAEAIVAAAQVNATKSNGLYSTKHNDKIDKLYIKSIGGTESSELANAIRDLDVSYQNDGTFATAIKVLISTTTEQYDGIIETYREHPEAKEVYLARKLSSIYFDKFLPGFYDGVIKNIEKAKKTSDKGIASAEECNRFLDEAVEKTEWFDEESKKAYKATAYQVKMNHVNKGTDPVIRESNLLAVKVTLINGLALSSIADNIGFLDENKDFTDPLMTRIMIENSSQY